MISLTEKYILSVGILILAIRKVISATKNNYLSKWESDLNQWQKIDLARWKSDLGQASEKVISSIKNDLSERKIYLSRNERDSDY